MAKKAPSKKSGKTSTRLRKHILSAVELEVVTRCRRHCCMCYGLKGTLKETEGQIAHLDRDRTNAIAENLAFLCLECHKKYDTKSNRVLGFTAAEIRLYREKLCRALKVDQTEWTITISVDNSKSEKIRSLIQKAHSDLLKECPDAKLSEGPMG